MLFYTCISHFYVSFYISHSTVNEISYFKDIANCISKKPFVLQPEGGFVRNPKHYLLILFYIIKVSLDCKVIYMLLIVVGVYQICSLKMTLEGVKHVGVTYCVTECLLNDILLHV